MKLILYLRFIIETVLIHLRSGDSPAHYLDAQPFEETHGLDKPVEGTVSLHYRIYCWRCIATLPQTNSRQRSYILQYCWRRIATYLGEYVPACYRDSTALVLDILTGHCGFKASLHDILNWPMELVS